MRKKVTKNYIGTLFLCIILIGIGVFLFVIDNERRHVSLNSNNIHIVLSETEWTKDNVELTVKYDGMASRHIKGYSFDGGKTWSKRNIYIVEDNQTIEIAVKDVNNKIYKLDYEVSNIDRQGPKIEIADNIQIQVNTNVNIDNYVSVIDEGIGLRDKVRFTPEINTRIKGKQTIQVYAIDKLANKTITSFDVEIIENAPVVAFTKLSLERQSLTLNVGEENTLALSYEPKYASTSRVRWLSSDPSVVTVDNAGKIKGIKKGNATITASVDEHEVTCEITVK